MFTRFFRYRQTPTLQNKQQHLRLYMYINEVYTQRAQAFAVYHFVEL